MSTCPVCEHVQSSGSSCEVCGLRLSGPDVVPDAPPPLEGLEPTRIASVSGAGAVEPMQGLEATRLPEGGVVAAGDASWVEPTRLRPAGDVEVEPLDVERVSSEEAPLAPDELFPAEACRYCRTPTAPGDVFCGRCGLRIVRFRSAAGAREVPAAEEISCRSCGTLGSGLVCLGCGARLPAPGQ